MQEQSNNQPYQNFNTQSHANPYMQGGASNHQEPNNYNIKSDLESNLSPSQDIHMSIRMGFIRKVYGILSFQLLLTVCIMSLAFIDSFNHFLKNNLTLFWITFGVSVAILIPLVCFRSIARGVPQNYILLFLWTLCEGYMLATCVAFYDPLTVIFAGFLTLAVTLSLTVYAFTTKTDFTMCGGLLFCLGTILFIWGIFTIIFGPILNTLYCVLGLVVYSIYLIYDTQLIIGKFGVEYNIDDYIYAALTIYLDIIQIFLYILEILGKRN
jgi:protein lifeguard